jgi:hypothetical protein
MKFKETIKMHMGKRQLKYKCPFAINYGDPK